MPVVRTEHTVRRASYTAAAEVDISTFDQGGILTTDGEVTPVGADTRPQFIFAESADVGDAVSVIYIQAGGRFGLRLSGTGDKGDKITTDASGHFVASDTAETAVLASKDVGVSLETWDNSGTIKKNVEVEVIA